MVSTSKIVDNFPHKTILPIVGQPTYAAIRDMHLKMNENCISVHSNLGNGLLGHLGISVTPDVYNTLSALPFVPPVNPGAAPAFPAGAQGPQIENIRRIFEEEQVIFNTYQNVQKAISALMIGAVDEIYFQALSRPLVGLATRTPLDMFTHLYQAYANINPADVQANDAHMRAAYDVNLPIETLFRQIENSIDYAAAGNTPYTPAQVLAIAYQIVFQTGLFADDCRDWKRQNAAYKTWPQFKVDFTRAHQEYRESQAILPSAAGFLADEFAPSDSQQETIDAIANLATATAADRTAVANLTTTVSDLTTALGKCNGKLVGALERVTVLTQQLAACKAGNSPRPASTNDSSGRSHYCWTCGYRCAHSSWNCDTPATGHQKRATRANTMNGSSTNKPTNT
jgi:hypothetical protein